MSTDYNILWQPVQINGMRLKNRLSMAPMKNLSPLSCGVESEDGVRYYEERAKGGLGLIQMGAMSIDAKAADGSLTIAYDNFSAVPATNALVERCHRWGAKICAQLSAGSGRYGNPNPANPPYSASETPCFSNKKLLCRAMSVEEIHAVVRAFGNAAATAKRMGFDAVDIHAHTGYLLDQFMTPLWNLRQDEYGGSLENRLRFLTEIIAEVRKKTGPSYPIIVRMTPEHHFEGGRTLAEGLEMLPLIEQAGADALDLDVGAYEAMDYLFPTSYMPDGVLAYICAECRKHTSLPIINTGAHTMETAAELIASGNADIVQFGRQSLADPHFANKLREGRRDDIRPCILCNEYCIGNLTQRLIMLSCTVNPACGYERNFEITPLPNAQKVAIIGAGPAGLEAARTAALRGADVTLYDKNSRTGGLLRQIATPPFKHRIIELLDWYERQLEQLKVKIELNCEIDLQSPKLAEADAIFVATGSLPRQLSIPGAELAVNVVDAHKNGISGQQVAVIGGGLSGCDCALELAMQGKQVTLVECGKRYASGSPGANLISLRRMFKEHNMQVLTTTRLVAVTEQGAQLQPAEGEAYLLPVDAVVLAVGQVPNATFADAVQQKYPMKTTLLGDCQQVDKAGPAIRDGFYAALSLQ